ncbi:hypothetical protein HWV62_44259 [Athelia sp. TMB]|nr:hypothetical protein HWV62_44259 [Athelia sp. TMB]
MHQASHTAQPCQKSTPPAPDHGGAPTDNGHEQEERYSGSPPPPSSPGAAPPPDLPSSKIFHPHLTGRPCDAEGNFLPTDAPAPPRPGQFGDWSPYEDEVQFRSADFLYRKVEMSAGNINELMELWAMSAGEHGDFSPFASFDHMYTMIDATKHGDAPWKCFSATYTGNLGEDAPSWQLAGYEVWYRDPDVVISNLLANPDYDGQFDYAPYVQLDDSGQRQWSDFMSGNLAWRHSDTIFNSDPETEGAMPCFVVLGADKTTVSVATGHVEYHPLYLSIGNVHNSVRRAHRNAVVPIGFLAIPKARPTDLDGLGATRSRTSDQELMDVLDSDQLWDNYGIDDDIIPFTSDFPRADIHEMLSPDLLHQLIKGTFKDHLITWVGEYLACVHGKAHAKDILDDIDRRFKQWTGDDSKALMKVYITTLVGHVPSEMIKCFASFMDACYIARRADFDIATLDAFDTAINKFYHHREIFRTSGVRPTGFSLPCQHSLKHYQRHIEEFGAPGGLCSSITESRHITAVKKPWRRSNRYAALGQMLLTNQRLNKLAAARTRFVQLGMLPPSHAPPQEQNNKNDEEGPVDDLVMGDVQLARTRARNYPRDIAELADHINEPSLPHLAATFLAEQLDIEEPVNIISKISVFNSAVATFYAPSNPSGIRGLRRERIRCTPSWRGQGHRCDTAFVAEDQDKPGMKGLRVVRIMLLFSFTHSGTVYPCALVEWFKTIGRNPHPNTGMWEVRPEFTGAHRDMSVLHLDTFLRAAHLLPVFDDRRLPLGFDYKYTLDLFPSFFVNKYVDHHAHEIAY